MNEKYKAENNGEEIPMYLAEFEGGVDKVTVSSTRENNKAQPRNEKQKVYAELNPKQEEAIYKIETYATAKYINSIESNIKG
jgi:hypothetical protein